MDLASYFYLNILTQIDASNCFMADMEPTSGLLLFIYGSQSLPHFARRLQSE